MSELEAEQPAERISSRHYLGIFLLSLATLLLELSLTRVLSVSLWYHFGFLVISTALLGFGTSGVVLALWRRLREDIPLDRALAVLGLLFGLLAAAIFGFRSAKKIATGALVLAAACFALAFFAGQLLPISITPNKLRPPQPPIYTAWNTFSKIDVYESKTLPRDPTGRGGRRFIFDAGTAAKGMMDLRPNVRETLRQLGDNRNYDSNIAYVGKTRPTILIIGSGGGSQVLDALHYGADKITAVEINPIINDVIKNRMRDYWGDLYQQPEVQVVTEEGRSFVRRSEEQYDAIISVHTISNDAIASGALSLAENYVLTREAFEDYLDHLKPDGVLYFTRPEAQISRLFSTGREALAARGATDLPSHFFAYRDAPSRRPTLASGPNRLSFSAGFLMKKSPYTAEEINAITKILRIGEPPATPEEGTTEVRYMPNEPPSDSIYYRLLTAPDLRTVY